MENENYAEATTELEKALFLRNNFPQAKLKLAFANLKMEDYDKAGYIFRDFLSQFQSSPLGLYGMALTEKKMGNREKAMASLKRALAINKQLVSERIKEDGEFEAGAATSSL